MSSAYQSALPVSGDQPPVTESQYSLRLNSYGALVGPHTPERPAHVVGIDDPLHEVGHPRRRLTRCDRRVRPFRRGLEGCTLLHPGEGQWLGFSAPTAHQLCVHHLTHCSALPWRSSPGTMASADSCRSIPTPRGVGSQIAWQADSPPGIRARSVVPSPPDLRHARLRVTGFAILGWLTHGVPPCIRFLCVRA
jgi:hypothetical protein